MRDVVGFGCLGAFLSILIVALNIAIVLGILYGAIRILQHTGVI